jgi:hypothetical protein
MQLQDADPVVVARGGAGGASRWVVCGGAGSSAAAGSIMKACQPCDIVLYRCLLLLLAAGKILTAATGPASAIDYRRRRARGQRNATRESVAMQQHLSLWLLAFCLTLRLNAVALAASPPSPPSLSHLVSAAAGAAAAAAAAAAVVAPHNYPVVPSRAIQRFDGIGAISGGGGETVLLPHYPAAQRGDILDLLFRPSYGASLHILKLEIGGDSLSTDGAEPSHMHTEFEEPNFQRGYELWLAKQAKKRNQEILLYGLPWEWPAWVGAGSGNPYQNVSRTVKYTTAWVKGAKQMHGLAVDYLGVWK